LQKIYWIEKLYLYVEEFKYITEVIKMKDRELYNISDNIEKIINSSNDEGVENFEFRVRDLLKNLKVVVNIIENRELKEMCNDAQENLKYTLERNELFLCKFTFDKYEKKQTNKNLKEYLTSLLKAKNQIKFDIYKLNDYLKTYKEKNDR